MKHAKNTPSVNTRSVKRRLFNLAAAGSLVLCVAAATLWVRSHWASDMVAIQSPFGSVLAYTYSGGAIWFGPHTSGPWIIELHEAQHFDGDFPTFYSPQFYCLGFAFGRAMDVGSWVATPFWAYVVVFATLPTIWIVRRYRRGSRQQSGRCPICGYDLRATPERCPECGTAVPPAQPQPQKAGNA